MKKDITPYINLYGKDLGRLCMALCKNAVDAEDLYQTTWEKVLKNLRRYDSTKDFDKWLFSICVNTRRNFRVRLVS